MPWSHREVTGLEVWSPSSQACRVSTFAGHCIGLDVAQLVLLYLLVSLSHVWLAGLDPGCVRCVTKHPFFSRMETTAICLLSLQVLIHSHGIPCLSGHNPKWLRLPEVNLVTVKTITKIPEAAPGRGTVVTWVRTLAHSH